jgi:threonyl-tRNA synthetase
LRSYRDLPIRYCELGTVYRYERTGVLHGLTRVRGFTQDDAHIFCTEDQLEDEIVGVIELVKYMLKSFGFSEYKMYLSTKPEKAVGSERIWEIATTALEKALKRTKQPYEIDPGEGVFYGPKIDVKLCDALGREWQGPTIQVDFNFPQKFDVNYIGPDGQKRQVVMIHRTVLGSMERFIGVLIEHCGGVFPVWLAPIQVILLPIADRHANYSVDIRSLMLDAGLRVEIDERNETVNKKIREAELQKIPYMLVVGDREIENKTVSVRSLKKKDMGQMKIEKFIEMVQKEIEKKTI